MGRTRFVSKCGFLFWVLIYVFIFFGACSAKGKKSVILLDTPEHHVLSGMKLMDKGKYMDAKREFHFAIQLNPKFSPAYTGLGLVNGYEGNFKEAFSFLKEGGNYSKKSDEKTDALVGLMRIYSVERKDNWVDKVEDTFKKAIAINPQSSASYYYMGDAYTLSSDFKNAEEMFRKVLTINHTHVIQATDQLNAVQKIQMASPQSVIGKKIALKEKITRAELAALFVQEFNLEYVYKKLSLKEAEAPVEVTDISDHALRVEIETLLKFGLKQIEPFPDNTFRPDDFVSRAAYAVIIEGLLSLATGNEKLTEKYMGAKSSFLDLRKDRPFYNAVIAVTSLGIMVSKDSTPTEFAPMEPVSGADALLAIRKLKEQLGLL